MQVSPDVFLLKIPIPEVELGAVNDYLIRTSEGSLLVDTGWNQDASYQALCSQLEAAGSSLADLKLIVVTHAHPDHFGLVNRIASETHAVLLMHSLEKAHVVNNYSQNGNHFKLLDGYMIAHGVPEKERLALHHFPTSNLGYSPIQMEERSVQGGELIRIGDFTLEVIWTPGHSSGHICLFEKRRGLLFSGDHVLNDISPNISISPDSARNPLGDYFNSLQKVGQLPVRLVLPSHGSPFSDLNRRISELTDHHEKRLEIILAAMGEEPKTAYQIAEVIPWSHPGTRWDDLSEFEKYMAVMETLAHLEFLLTQGKLVKLVENGLVTFSSKIV